MLHTLVFIDLDVPTEMDVATAESECLPGMAHCPDHRTLDDGIAKILDVPDLSSLDDLLASEPVISNRRL